MSAGVPHPARRRVGVLTTGRQDWGLLRSTCQALAETDGVEPALLVGGMHLSARHGRTVDDIRTAGFEPTMELPWLDDGADQPADVQAARAMEACGAAFRSTRIDAVVLAGDRLETAAAALAATFERVPIVHLHGGEQTAGSFDDVLRNAITKLSHLHLVSHPEHQRRVIAMGEDPAAVFVIGAPGLDAAHRSDLAPRDELETWLGIDLEPPVVIVTIQPATLDEDPTAIAAPILEAMSRVAATYVLTLPNSDPGGDAIRRAIGTASGNIARIVLTEALGERRYWGLLRLADAMLGNSSSGIIEAPEVDLPAVNVGDRQAGRRRQANVIDVPASAADIEQALRRALDPATRRSMMDLHPAASDGRAGRRAADIIAAWNPPRPPRKAPISVEP